MREREGAVAVSAQDPDNESRTARCGGPDVDIADVHVAVAEQIADGERGVLIGAQVGGREAALAIVEQQVHRTAAARVRHQVNEIR